jgi:hypothetical protein
MGHTARSNAAKLLLSATALTATLLGTQAGSASAASHASPASPSSPSSAPSPARAPSPASPASGGAASGFVSSVFADAAGITHQASTGKVEAVSGLDDITAWHGQIFVGFPNGVGPQGQASKTGNLDSTIVEFDGRGQERAQWDILGKCDGLTADPATGELIATVNEDANSSIYLIDPTRSTVAHFTYNQPLAHNGGTDAISLYRGEVLVSASAPGTTGAPAPQPSYPAVYTVTFDRQAGVADVAPLFSDEASATVANTNSAAYGTSVQLGLTDPDSSEVVPAHAPRFAGDFMLTSQGDAQQIYVGSGPEASLSVLNLSDSINDTAWANGRSGHLLATDSANDIIYAIHGRFQPGQAFVVDTPCGANAAPAVCPAPGFGPNFLGVLNLDTGQISPLSFTGPALEPQGLIFVH